MLSLLSVVEGGNWVVVMIALDDTGRPQQLAAVLQRTRRMSNN